MKKNNRITITNLIILVCTIVYILDRFVFVGDINEIGEFSLSIAGKELGQNVLLIKCLGLVFGKIYYFMAISPVSIESLKIWQPFTYMFMHQFVFHLIVNMVALYIVGNKIEKEKGKLFAALGFITIGIIGLFITNFIIQECDAYTAGASISIFGIIGIAIGMILTNKSFIKNFKRKSIVYLILYGLIFTYTSGIWTIVAHNIGLILGIIFYYIWNRISIKNKVV